MFWGRERLITYDLDFQVMYTGSSLGKKWEQKGTQVLRDTVRSMVAPSMGSGDRQTYPTVSSDIILSTSLQNHSPVVSAAREWEASWWGLEDITHVKHSVRAQYMEVITVTTPLSAGSLFPDPQWVPETLASSKTLYIFFLLHIYTDNKL